MSYGPRGLVGCGGLLLALPPSRVGKGTHISATCYPKAWV